MPVRMSRCACIAPLGRPVDPDEYTRYARSSGCTAATGAGVPPSSAAAVTTAAPPSSASSRSVTTTAGSQSSTTAARAAGSPSGSIGTGTAPIRAAPRNACSHPRPSRSATITRSPRRAPASWSAPAARAEAAESSRKVQEPVSSTAAGRSAAAPRACRSTTSSTRLCSARALRGGGPAGAGAGARAGSAASASAVRASGGTREGSTSTASVTPASPCASSAAPSASGAATMPVPSSQRIRAAGVVPSACASGGQPGERLAPRRHGEGERVERARQPRPPGRPACPVGQRQPARHLGRVGERHHDAVRPLPRQPQQPGLVRGEPDRRAAGGDRPGVVGRGAGRPGEHRRASCRAPRPAPRCAPPARRTGCRRRGARPRPSRCPGPPPAGPR